MDRNAWLLLPEAQAEPRADPTGEEMEVTEADGSARKLAFLSPEEFAAKSAETRLTNSAEEDARISREQSPPP